MARGKHATSADARRARESAEAEARRLGSENARLSEENDGLRAQVSSLRNDVAQGVSADLRRAQQELATTQADLREARELLGEAERIMLSIYEQSVIQNMKSGLPFDAACSRAEQVTTFFIKGEFLSPGDVESDWEKGPKLKRARKRPPHRRKGYAAADRIDEQRQRESYARQQQGIE